jgi:hypothetical protein
VWADSSKAVYMMATSETRRSGEGVLVEVKTVLFQLMLYYMRLAPRSQHTASAHRGL